METSRSLAPFGDFPATASKAFAARVSSTRESSRTGDLHGGSAWHFVTGTRRIVRTNAWSFIGPIHGSFVTVARNLETRRRNAVTGRLVRLWGLRGIASARDIRNLVHPTAVTRLVRDLDGGSIRFAIVLNASIVPDATRSLALGNTFPIEFARSLTRSPEIRGFIQRVAGWIGARDFP